MGIKPTNSNGVPAKLHQLIFIRPESLSFLPETGGGGVVGETGRSIF